MFIIFRIYFYKGKKKLAFSARLAKQICLAMVKYPHTFAVATDAFSEEGMG
jgi:hypothetical protein